MATAAAEANPNPNPLRLPLPSSTSSRVTPEAVGRAVDSLLHWLRKQAKQRKAQLLEHDDLIHLVLSMKKIPAKGRTNPYLIPLPHPLHPFDGPSAAAVCLFIDDRPSSPVSPAAVEDKIRVEGIPISEVITLSGLRADYRPYEARRRLCGSYDLFLADRRILPLLPRLLGKQFFKKKKHPIPLELSHKGWKEQLRRCLGSAKFYLRTGTCCHLDVGRASQGRDEVVENILAAVEGAVGRIPKKWANVRSIHLKSDESVALPIYQAVPEMGFKIAGFQKKEQQEEEDEGGIVDGEVLQRGKDEEQQEKKKLGTKKGSKKGRIREVRYMDTNLDDEDLVSDLPCNNGDGDEEINDESDGEKKKKETKKKKKKDAKVVKTGSQGSDEGAASIDGVKKRKSKCKKLDGGEAKTKINKKNKMRHETD